MVNSLFFENQGANTYLVYETKENDTVDSMSLGMLTNNKIPGLASVLFTQMDATRYIKYNVSARVSVKQFFDGPVNKKRLIGVFNGIVDAMLSAEDYMIDINTIILDLDYIFADVSTCETVLICMPIINDEFQSVELGKFFKDIMFSTQFDQTENCDHVAKIMNYLNSTPVFSLTDFKELLNDMDTQTQSSNVVNKPQQVVPQQTIQPMKQQPVVQKIKEEQPKNEVVQPVIAKPSPIDTIANKTIETIPASQTQEETNKVKPEKKISMFDLLMHYSKENVELYKAQKEAEKEMVSSKVSSNNKKVKQNSESVSNMGFAIPGQPTTNDILSQQPKVEPEKNPHNEKVSVSNIPKNTTISNTPLVSQVNSVPHGKPMNFGETTVLGGGNIGETTVLSAIPTVAEPNPHLIRMKNNEKVYLNKPVFRIGKEKSYVDYFINDNTAVSRSHANIICRDSKYFVMDTNSTNHTYVNGVMLQSNVEKQLSQGDKVRFANEDFEFKLY